MEHRSRPYWMRLATARRRRRSRPPGVGSGPRRSRGLDATISADGGRGAPYADYVGISCPSSALALRATNRPPDPVGRTAGTRAERTDAVAHRPISENPLFKGFSEYRYRDSKSLGGVLNKPFPLVQAVPSPLGTAENRCFQTPFGAHLARSRAHASRANRTTLPKACPDGR